MGRARRSRKSKTLAPFAVGCVLVGAAIFISTGLRDESLGSVVAGLGFAAFGLSTYLDPVVFETPLLEALRRAPVKAPLEQGLDFVAVLLIASGLLLRWSAF